MSGEYGGWGRTSQLSGSKVSLTTIVTCGRVLSCWKITLSCLLAYWGRFNFNAQLNCINCCWKRSAVMVSWGWSSTALASCHSWNAGTNTHMFLLLELVPHTFHITIDVLQLHFPSSWSKKAALSTNVVLLAKKLTCLEHKEGVLFTLQQNDTYWLLEENGDVLTWI